VRAVKLNAGRENVSGELNECRRLSKGIGMLGKTAAWISSPARLGREHGRTIFTKPVDSWVAFLDLRPEFSFEDP
jgi:hypothetical protein